MLSDTAHNALIDALALAIAKSDDEKAVREDWGEETWARYRKYATAALTALPEIT